MDVNSEVFGDPCPGTHKYVEVHFACAPRLLATTTKRPLPPWFLQGGADNLWNNPNESNNPTSSSTTANATNPTVATKNIFSISDVVPHVTDKRKPILVTSDVTSTTPVRIPITTSTTSTTTTTTTTTTTSTTSTTTTEKAEAKGITDISNAYEIQSTG